MWRGIKNRPLVGYTKMHPRARKRSTHTQTALMVNGLHTYILIYLLTYSLTYRLIAWSRVLLEKLTGSQLVKEIPCLLWNTKVHYRICKCSPHLPILSQLDPVHTSTSKFLKTHLNIFLPSVPGSPKWSLSLGFPNQNPVYAFPLPLTRYMSRPSHSSRFFTRKILREGTDH